MSDLQRSFAKAKLISLPAEAPIPLDEDIEEEDDEAGEDQLLPLPSPGAQTDDSSSSASSASSAGTIKPSPSKHLFARPKGSFGSRSNSQQLPWTDFFEQELYLERSSDSYVITHHAYLTPPQPKEPLFVTHHGAGSSGLSFAVVASEIRKKLPGAGILSLDARGHGETAIRPIAMNGATASPSPTPEFLDLSLETLSEDFISVINLARDRLGWPQRPDLVLIGHSLGGAVITNVANSGKLGDSTCAYAVLDVVEGSAIDALQSMQSYLSARPKAFPSIASGIQWHTRSRTIRSDTSARVSVPALLVPSPPTPSSTSPQGFVWRTDLAATEPFWESWFKGLSSKFLSAKGGKLLLLAGTDRLDKELMIGQMQGKYQLQVFPDAGHFIQEDQPAKTAMVLVDFWNRNNRKALVLPPKVGDLLKAQREKASAEAGTSDA